MKNWRLSIDQHLALFRKRSDIAIVTMEDEKEPYRMVPLFPMTLSDPNPDFKVTPIANIRRYKINTYLGL